MSDQRAMAPPGGKENAAKLLKLAQAQFASRGGLWPAEEKLIHAAARGEVAWLCPGLDDILRRKLEVFREKQAKARIENKPEPQTPGELKPLLPAFADTWGEERNVRAGLVAWLCTNPDAAKLVSHRGVRLAGARVEGILYLSYARIPFPLWLRDSALAEKIHLLDSRLPELLLAGSHTKEIAADALKVEGGVFLRNGFRAEGEVRLLGARIGGELACVGGKFVNPNGRALNADGLKVEGNALLSDGFRAEGRVSLVAARIGGYLKWVRLENPQKATLDLRSARVGTLWDEAKSWPPAGHLFLHGFEYANLEDEVPTDAKSRLDWLRRQPQEKGKFFPQPYEQLAKVLREQGHEEDARQVLIGKNDDRAKFAEMTCFQRLCHRVLGNTIAYGYRPWRALVLSVIMVVLGSLVFWWAGANSIMVPTTQSRAEIVPFDPAMYSIDVFLPIVDFHQESAWVPDASAPWGWLVRRYMWLHIALGWVLTSLWVAGLSGLVKR